MHNRKIRVGRTLLLSLCSAFTLPSFSQDAALENWYKIEVIVFSQQDTYGQEVYPENPDLAYPQTLRFLDSEAQSNLQLSANPGLNEQLAVLMIPDRLQHRETTKQRTGFVALDKSARQLNPDAYTLDRSGRYKVLFHNAWEQEIQGPTSAPWVYVAGGEKFDQHRQLEGSIRLFRSRFLHVDLNLWLSQFTPGAVNTPVTAALAPTADNVPFQEKPPFVLPDPPKQNEFGLLRRLQAMDAQSTSDFSIDQSSNNTVPAAIPRRFTVANVDVLERSDQVGVNKLAYMDHPRMGVLVLVSPVAASENAEDEAIDE